MAIVHDIYHDGEVHHPLGAGSYIFQRNLVYHLIQYCTKDQIIIQLGAQPNSSPHMGTLFTSAMAFALAAAIKETLGDSSKIVKVSFDIVDTAPSEQLVIDGIKYQRSQRFTGEMSSYLDDFVHAMNSFQEYSGIPWTLRNQEEFLSHPSMPGIIQQVIERRDALAMSFAPETKCLALRSPCPRYGCGLADKHGIKNIYNDNDKTISFHCPHHGQYIVDTTTSTGVCTLEFNTPLRNFVRGLAFVEDEDASWIRVTGADYAGYYQEQLLWRHLPKPLLIVYAPQITDWSGVKLSKSLYVKKGAYKYLSLQNLDYLVSYKEFQAQKKELRIVYTEVAKWVDNPYMLFRSYSISYILTLFDAKEVPNHVPLHSLLGANEVLPDSRGFLDEGRVNMDIIGAENGILPSL